MFLIRFPVHCEKNIAGSPKTRQNYRLFVKILGIFRRKCEVHYIRWHLQTIPMDLRNICKNCNKSHVTFYKIPVLWWLCMLHVKYLKNVTGISHNITIFNTRHLKVQTILHDFQCCLQNMHIQVSKHRTALCVSLKGSEINKKFVFKKNFYNSSSMQSNIFMPVQKLCSWWVCESRGTKKLSDYIKW